MVQGILKAEKHMQHAGITEEDKNNMTQYSISRMYMQMRGTKEKVGWRSLVWSNYCAPNDRLGKWGITQSLACSLCESVDVVPDHIFFQCAYAAEV